MAQQYNPQGINPQNIKKRYAVLVFYKRFNSTFGIVCERCSGFV